MLSLSSSLPLIAIYFTCTPAHARLGESVSIFINKNKDVYKLKGTSSSEGVTHYNFSLIVDETERSAAPGFGAGLTVTVQAGKIVGQSMALSLGRDRFIGAQLAGAYGLKFALDAIGRTMPGDKRAQDKELEVFNKTAAEALLGMPREISYPGFDARIILSKSQDGNLLVAVVKRAKPVNPVP
jgi:hypothetical protein